MNGGIFQLKQLAHKNYNKCILHFNNNFAHHFNERSIFGASSSNSLFYVKNSNIFANDFIFFHYENFCYEKFIFFILKIFTSTKGSITSLAWLFSLGFFDHEDLGWSLKTKYILDILKKINELLFINELTTLSGTKVGVVIFSPLGKPYSFAHPYVDSLANRFLNRNPPNNDITHAIVKAYKKFMLDETKQKHNKTLEKVELENERNKMVEIMNN
uniref:MADS17 n=1 Tax=Hippophae rhamnoides TaxID=193516 RepID=A0AAU7LJA3_9ROSA